MYRKFMHISELADIYTKRVASSPENWMHMLTTASRLYKYPFDEQLLIHAQRPNATACATFDTWKKSMKRYVKRDSKGIALLDAESGRQKLKYVFDLSDTAAGRKDAKTPIPWQLSHENEFKIRELLLHRLLQETIAETTLSNVSTEELIHNVSLELSQSYVAENNNDILHALEGSELSKFEPTVAGQRESENIFTQTLVDSIAFTIIQRCGFDGKEALNKAYADYEETAFQHINKFNSPQSLKALGEGVSTLSEEVLRAIEALIKQLQNERSVTPQREGRDLDANTRIHPQRGLSDTRHQIAGAREEPAIIGQIRNDAQKLSKEPSADNLHKFETQRKSILPLSGTGDPSKGTVRDNDVAINAELPITKQGDRPTGLGGSHDGTESPSGGSNHQRDYLHINEKMPPIKGGIFDTGQNPVQLTVDMLPSEEQQRTEIENEEQLETDTQSLKITDEDINTTLIQWNGDSESKNRVNEYMRTAQNARALDTANFLQKEYGGNLHGINITKEGAAQLFLSWEKVQKHIGMLVENERFIQPLITSHPLTLHQPEIRLPDTPITTAPSFRISDPHLGEGGPKTKYGYNIEAIHTLKRIEAEERYATQEEQIILSRYVGWGGIQQAFDKNAKGWTREYDELRAALSTDEHKAARASTLNAHYTSPIVISAIYEALERMGVKTGNILEPSCGVGNFLGLLPDSMQNAKLYGVELDPISGRIAQQLYPSSDIKIMGFEKTQMPDSFFDVAIGNVPFGGFGVVDKKYDKHNFMIHDYFFAKAIDQVRPGGIIAFITSKGTLDKSNPKVRKYLAERADLLGAVRLPNNAFLKNAGTEVTSDIIFLQKRDTLQLGDVDWVHLGETENGIPINNYFVNNSHMILGTMSKESGKRMYGNEDATTCLPIEGAVATQLQAALFNIQGTISEKEQHIEKLSASAEAQIIPADPHVKNYSYTVVGGTVYFRENSIMRTVDKPDITLDRIKGMVTLRNITRELIETQMQNAPSSEINVLQSKLTSTYDNFTSKYGLLSSPANARAFDDDAAYYLLSSLEVIDEDGNFKRKSDIFDKRTIKHYQEITSANSSAEALAVSISRKACANMQYMITLTGFSEEKIASDLKGVIFELPNTKSADGQKVYATADEYLSGNVREKLAIAEAAVADDQNFKTHVSALAQAQPKELDASEISVRLGSTWVDKEYYSQFIHELLQTPEWKKKDIKLHHSTATCEWSISGKTLVRSDDVLATNTYGTNRANAFTIFEQSLNLRDIRIYDISIEAGKEKRVLNKNETILAQQKQEALKQAFKEWVYNDPDRRQALVAKYNILFNSTRPREFDGSHIELVGASPEISLRPHQRAAIARILYGGNTLLAHEVGAGKTFEMIGAAMESKRIGLCNKSMFVVPNHIIEDIASEFLRLYPAANVLVASKKDFEPKNRKRFCARIATGDYDAVIIGHFQFEKIPLSKERQELILREQIQDIVTSLESIKIAKGERFTIKQLEKTKKSLETRLAKLTDDKRKDDVVTFEQLGVDRLFVDEAHNYKELCYRGSFKKGTLLL